VSDDVLPSGQERALLFVTNEVRNDPRPWPTPLDAGHDRWPCKDGDPDHLPPLEWNRQLAAAARFHANDMYVNDHFEHTSSDGTPFGERIARYYDQGPAGENIALGQTSAAAVLGDWMTSPGHRCNILGEDWLELGTGYAATEGGGARHFVQNFGRRDGVRRTKIPGGAAFIISNRKARYGANWYDPESMGVDAVLVVVRGSGCRELSLTAGLPHQGTYDWAGPYEASDAEYWFLGIDGAGDPHAYPAEGALRAVQPLHVDDRVDERPMPECAELLLAGQPLPGGHAGGASVEPGSDPDAGGDAVGERSHTTTSAERRRGESGCAHAATGWGAFRGWMRR